VSAPPQTRTAGSLVRHWLPIVTWLPRYQRSWLREDVTAGLALTALLVPQGMAYAQLAGLPPITGLYTSVMCLIAYAVAGPSRVLVLGPDSSLGPMIAATVLPLVAAGGDPARAVVLASVLSILVGLFMIAAGVARLGFVADLLSKPTQIGYMNGLALTILVGQVRKLFGFSIEADGLPGEITATAGRILDGATNPAALTVGAASLAIVLVLLVHGVETAKFIAAWSQYKVAVRALAMGSEADPALGDPRFVSSHRIAAGPNRLAWSSTTPYLAVLLAPDLDPARLVVDPDAGYFWLSCATASRSETKGTAVPAPARRLIRLHACLNR